MVYFDDQIIILHQNHQMNLLLFDVHTVFMSEFFNGVLNQEHVIEANKQMCMQSSEEFGLVVTGRINFRMIETSFRSS